MGESAGGHLAFLMGTTNGNKIHENLTMGNSKYSSDVQVAVGYFAPTTFLVHRNSSEADLIMSYALLGSEIMNFTDEIMELEKQMSPSFMVSEKSVPLFITHSTKDGTVPIYHSEKLYEAAKNYLSGKDLKKIFYDYGGHGDRSTFDTPSSYVAVTEFIDSHNPSNSKRETSNYKYINFTLITIVISMLLLFFF